jgi:DNA polymerase-3 subunit alpha
LKYGILSPEEIVDLAIELGYKSVLLADINTTGSALAFIRAAKRKGIKPIVGAEIRNGMEIIGTIIAKNQDGFNELNVFLSKHLAAGKAFPDSIPTIKNCIVSYSVSKAINELKENEYFDIQLNELINLNYKFKNIEQSKVIILQTMTFRSKRDFNTHRLLRAIANNTLLSKLPKVEQTSEDEKFISKIEFEKALELYPELLKQTQFLFESCDIDFKFGDEAIPQNPISYTDSIENDKALLRKLCLEGLSFRYPEVTEQIRSRIDMELEIIAEKQYLSYFLIAWDFTSYARSKNYFYVGRGSGANSIVAYLLRITDVDPLELDLYFERFINLYRKNPPDFDIDFSWKDRDEIITYLFNKFPNSAWLCTYNTFQYRAAIRELGKVFGLPKTEIDILCSGKYALENVDEMSKLVLKYAKSIEGLPSYLSVHSGGIVISEKPITYFSSTFLPPKGYPTTQFSMMEAEDVGLYKFDVLSQRGLGKIAECLEIISYNQPDVEPHDIHDIAFFKQDKKIEEILLHAKALGCFYVESPAMRMLMLKLNVRTYLELVAASSIIRPGVSQSGMMREYILRHKNPERRATAHPELLKIMPETYGVMVYQEDVIKVAHHFAGLNLAQADVLRRGMSGKFRSREEFQSIKDSFFENCLKKGFEPNLTADVWRQIESFAGYAFSKGHSASYAVESYQSLYLKAYFPLEFMTAVINNFGGYYRTEVYVHEARKWGAEIEAPSINEGSYSCILKGKRLILGFNLVAGIEDELIIQVFEERNKNGKFQDFEDLMKRFPIPLEQVAIIIRIGALRDFQEFRKELLWKAHFFHHHHQSKPTELELFDVKPVSFELPKLEENKFELIFDQMELLGFPLCNPFELLKDEIPKKHLKASEIKNCLGTIVETYAYLVSIKQSKTAQGQTMSFGTFLDIEGETLDTVHFPESLRKFPFVGKGIYYLKGFVSEEFGFYTLEVGQMKKLRFIEDVRFEEVNSQ